MFLLCRILQYGHILFNFRNLRAKFEEMLRESGALTGSPLVMFMDGLDMMEPAYLPHTLDWLPELMPKVCRCVIFIEQ